MNIHNSVVFVTGANRGIGKAFVEALVRSGARRIYATARSIESLTDVVALAPDRIIPIALDVTDLDRVKAAAQSAQANQGTQVVGVFPGPVDTAMTEGLPVDKVEPIDVAQAVLQAVDAGLEDVYPDPVSQSAFAAIAEPLKTVEKMFAGWMPQ